MTKNYDSTKSGVIRLRKKKVGIKTVRLQVFQKSQQISDDKVIFQKHPSQ